MAKLSKFKDLLIAPLGQSISLVKTNTSITLAIRSFIDLNTRVL